LRRDAVARHYAVEENVHRRSLMAKPIPVHVAQDG
jgi:hypothetical protein